MLSQLPVELLENILQCAPRPDLLALSLTHPFLHPIAQRLLYRNISVGFPIRNTRVIISLAQKPELARHVRTLSIRLDPCAAFPNPFYQHLAQALSHMSELTSLDLFVDPSASWVLQGTHSISFPRLVHFGCSFPLDINVTAFLANTDGLLELELDATSNDSLSLSTALPAASLPRLSHFVGSSHVAQAVVPGRPVESIHLSSGDLTETDVVMLSKSSAHVVILGATTSSLPMPLLESLTQYMPHLVYLRMMTTYNFSEAPDVLFYENVGNALASLSDLQAFELSGMHWGPPSNNINDKGRVWQQPLTSDFSDTPIDDDIDPELYFVY